MCSLLQVKVEVSVPASIAVGFTETATVGGSGGFSAVSVAVSLAVPPLPVQLTVKLCSPAVNGPRFAIVPLTARVLPP
ncbi:MAG: hypothetical protein OXH27_02460 [Gammaproteobacteria bacterium]|nr:hypothetical protein [Gammaproteobacteria bacterium]MYC60685.1 hypothetical protein [Gammaproteobacteria bacterium]